MVMSIVTYSKRKNWWKLMFSAEKLTNDRRGDIVIQITKTVSKFNPESVPLETPL
jgi:hypothetical protein